MSEERFEVKEILRRLDELLRILKFLGEDLSDISKNLRMIVNQLPSESQITVGVGDSRPLVQAGETSNVEDVQKMFPQELSRMLYFEVTNDYVLIRPRQYLGSDNFAKIATVIRDQFKGEYVSQGKESHFRIPRKT